MGEPFRNELWEMPRLFWSCIQFCDSTTLAAVNATCRRWRLLYCHNTFWEQMFVRFNLQALLLFIPPPRADGYKRKNGTVVESESEEQIARMTSRTYRYFISQVVTGAALRGKFSFSANESEEYSIMGLEMRVSKAHLGSVREISKAKLRISYRSTVEIWHGAIRFSPSRKCFTLCCTLINNPKMRGPCYTVVIGVAQRKWANQADDQFMEHKGGLRLIMTPVSVKSTVRGSEITETDVISVSRPPPEGMGSTVYGSPSLSPKMGFM